MFKDELTRLILGGEPTMLPLRLGQPAEAVAPAQKPAVSSGRWAVETYAFAWQRLCNAAWREELEDPIFRRAVERAIEDEQVMVDAPWPHSEDFRDYVRSWWLLAREHYRSPDDVPSDWIIEQRE